MLTFDPTPSDHPPWMVLIYQTATPETQHEILRRLTAVTHGDVAVIGLTSGRDSYVVADCPDLPQGELIDDVVTTVDCTAHLIHTAHSPDRRAPAHRAQDRGRGGGIRTRG